MLARVLRLPGKLLGALAVAVLLVHGAWVVSRLRWLSTEDEFASLGFFLNLLMPAFFLAAGRVLLACLPPGEVGRHDPRGLPVTLATSLVLGCLATTRLEGIVPSFVTVYAAVLGLALLRWVTLPGAMVPRHRVAAEPRGPLDALSVLAGMLWAAFLPTTEGGVDALLWFALAVLLFHGLGVARRRRAWRHGLLWLVALSGAAYEALGALDGILPVLSIGLGATFLIGWLRRADRRAGALAGIGFGSLFLGGCDPLALAGALVFVLASHPRQRVFASSWVGAAGALSLVLAWLHGGVLPTPRARLLLAEELGFRFESWGLAWPSVLGALALGALTFRWRAEAWQPGRLEEPRREAKALCALLALACVAFVLPISPWSEEEALLILFPPCTLLAGLLLVPAESAPSLA